MKPVDDAAEDREWKADREGQADQQDDELSRLPLVRGQVEEIAGFQATTADDRQRHQPDAREHEEQRARDLVDGLRIPPRAVVCDEALYRRRRSRDSSSGK